MNSHGEIEAAICEGIRRFEHEYMGRGPKSIHAHLWGDLVVVRLCGVLTAAEQHLAKALSAREGEGTAQASPDPSHRNCAADDGSDDRGGDRCKGCEFTPRHQHYYRRGDYCLYARRIAGVSGGEEEITILLVQQRGSAIASASGFPAPATLLRPPALPIIAECPNANSVASN